MRLPVSTLSAVLLFATAGDAVHTTGPPAPAVIEAGASGCGTGWTRPHTGRQTLTLRNDGGTVSGVALIAPATGAVYAELETIAPGTTRQMRVTLGPGVYAFRCVQDGPSSPVTGPATRVTGPGAGGPGVVPVAMADLYGPLRTYRAYVIAGLDRLVARTDALRTAVDDGDLPAARAAWTPAHLAYERLGAAYGTFGDLDGRINGLPDGLPGGVHDPAFTGFHRVEYGLWHGAPASSLAGPADRLDRDVRRLRAAFPDKRIEPLDLSLRAHEILENTLQFQLTGEADQGSGTSLRTAAANLEGTRAVLDALRPLLRSRYPGLPGVDTWMDRLAALLKGRSDVRRLSRAERERLDGTAGELLERLAPIATICAPRRVR